MSGTEIAIVLGASLLGAFVKSVTGMGYPLLAVPLITLAVGIEDAVVVVAAPNMFANLVLCYGARSGRDEARDLGRLIGFGFGGAILGTYALVSVPEDPLLIVLALTIVGFIVNFVRSPELRIRPEVSHRWAPFVGGAAGIMQGAVGVSGPVVATWLHGYRLGKAGYVYSVTAIFGVTGLVQFVLLVFAGKLTADRVVVSALAFVPVVAMIPLGTSLRHRLGGSGFERAVLGVLVASGLALVIQVLS